MFFSLLASGMSTGVKILIFILVLLAAGGVIYLLYRGIVKDTRRLKIVKREVSELEKNAFIELLEKKFVSADEKTQFSVVFVELCDAVGIKEAYGEKEYANILLTLLTRIGSAFPHSAKICVYEMDLFAIFIDGVEDENQLGELCARCISEARKEIKLSKKRRLTADVNVGAALYDPLVGDSVRFLLNLDAALVNSKRKGSNSYFIFDASTDTEDSAYYLEIKQAISENEFSLYFQPIYDLNLNEPIAYESLLRWNHKRLGGMLQPVKFLYAMERSGDINWVGLWAFEQLLIARRHYTEEHGEKNMIFSLNLSNKQLADGKLCDELLHVLKRYRVSAGDICFEIGEGILLDKSEIVKENLEKLSQCGFKIAIDNFRLDAISFLEKQTVDWVKLDKSILDGARDGMVNEAVIAQLVAQSSEKSYKLIAQGIEDNVTLDYVRAEGISYGQGFLLGKPLSAKDYQL